MYKKFIIILSFLIFASNITLAQENNSNNIAIIDVKQILSESVAAKNILSDLNKKLEEYQIDINTKTKSLQKKQDMLKEQAAVLSEDMINKKQQEIFQQLQVLEQEVANKKNKLQEAYGQTLAKIEKEIMKIISDISQENNYNLVLTTENLLFHQNIPDISKNVVTILNKKLPKIELTIN